MFNIGSLSPQKQPALFAETMATVCERRDELYCVIAGGGPKADAVAEHTSEKLRAIGFVSDDEKWRWFDDADLFASLSVYEGMPVATLEALSFGCPVVLSDIPAHRAVVDEHDANGECVPPDPTAVAEAITRVENKTAAVSLPTWGDVAAEYPALIE